MKTNENRIKTIFKSIKIILKPYSNLLKPKSARNRVVYMVSVPNLVIRGPLRGPGLPNLGRGSLQGVVGPSLAGKRPKTETQI